MRKDVWGRQRCDVSLADVSPVFRCVVDGNYGAGATEHDAILGPHCMLSPDIVLGANVLHAFGAFEWLIEILEEVVQVPDTWSAISDACARRYVKLTKLVQDILVHCDMLVDPYAATSAALSRDESDGMRRAQNMAAKGLFSREESRNFLLTKGGGSKLKEVAFLMTECFASIPADPVIRLLEGGKLLGARAPRPEETADQAPPPVAVTRTPSERAAAEAAARDSFAVELPPPAPSRARKGKKKSASGKKKR